MHHIWFLDWITHQFCVTWFLEKLYFKLDSAFTCPKSEGCPKVHSPSLFSFSRPSQWCAVLVTVLMQNARGRECCSAISPYPWRSLVFWWPWGLSHVLSSELSYSQLQELSSELFALHQLVLTHSPHQSWGGTCLHGKGSEHCPCLKPFLSPSGLWLFGFFFLLYEHVQKKKVL